MAKSRRMFTWLFTLCAWMLITACSTESTHLPGITATELPAPLSLIDAADLQIAHSCPEGGVKIIHGVDYNADGQLGIYEQLNVEYLCNPTLNGANDSDIVVTHADNKGTIYMPSLSDKRM